MKTLAELAGLSEEDLEICPNCGSQRSHWLQELDRVWRWQPCSLAVDPDNGLMPGDYYEWQVSDDGESGEAVAECRECMHSWPTWDALERALVAAKFARADADFLEQTMGTKLHNALAVFLTNPNLRLAIENDDPQGLIQARAALGLPERPTLADLATAASDTEGGSA